MAAPGGGLLGWLSGGSLGGSGGCVCWSYGKREVSPWVAPRGLDFVVVANCDAA